MSEYTRYMVGGPSLAEDVAQDGLGDVSEPEIKAKHSGKLLVRMPATLHDDLARAAESEGVSLNQLITGVLAGAVGWRAQDGQAAPGETGSPRTNRIVLIANLAVLLVVAVAAIALLAIAWRDGW
jgi:hypothetical protein